MATCSESIDTDAFVTQFHSHLLREPDDRVLGGRIGCPVWDRDHSEGSGQIDDRPLAAAGDDGASERLRANRAAKVDVDDSPPLLGD